MLPLFDGSRLSFSISGSLALPGTSFADHLDVSIPVRSIVCIDTELTLPSDAVHGLLGYIDLVSVGTEVEIDAGCH